MQGSPKAWHANVAKFDDLIAWLAINQVNVIPNVMVVHNEKGIFELRGISTRQYWPHKVLLDFGVQPLLLDKDIVDNIGLTILVLTHVHTRFWHQWATQKELLIKPTFKKDFHIKKHYSQLVKIIYCHNHWVRIQNTRCVLHIYSQTIEIVKFEIPNLVF